MVSRETFQVECECGESMALEEYSHHKCLVPPTAGISSTSQNYSQGSQDESENSGIPKLVEAVQARTALWDHTLPLKLRGKDIRERLWKEVHQEIGGKIPLSQLERKWRNLKDTFLKHLKTYNPSGSGVDEKKKWKHFDLLFFLAGINSPRPTVANVSQSEPPSEAEHGLSSTSSISVSENGFSPIETEVTPSKKRRKTDETEQLLLNILKEKPLPQPQISPALLNAQSLLEKLPLRVRLQAEIEILNKVYSLYSDYCSE